jgi:Putative adhesin
MADVVAKSGEAGAVRRRRFLRTRPAPWTLLVAGSVVVLLGTAIAFAATWLATTSKSTTEYTALVPGTLLRVELTVASGDVEVLGGATADVLVNRTDTSTFGHSPEERRIISDGVLRIESTCPKLVVGSCEADYRLTVPETVPLTISAQSGDVRLVAYRGNVTVSTSDGSLTVDAFCGPTLDATAGSGDVEVIATCSADRLAFLTTSGDVAVRVPPDLYDVDAETITGDAEVRGVTDEPGAPFRIQVSTNSGDVLVEAGS